MVLQNVDKAQVKLRMKKDNVAGMYTVGKSWIWGGGEQ